jgi:hypothetical protein
MPGYNNTKQAACQTLERRNDGLVVRRALAGLRRNLWRLSADEVR